MVADTHACDVSADRLDDPGALVPQHGGAPRGRRAVDRVPVRVADAARVEANENLPRMRRRELHLDDLELRSDGLEDCGAHVHARTGATPDRCEARSSSTGM